MNKKKTDVKKDNNFEELNQLNNLLREIDDRGLVLALSAFAEDALGSLLKAFMVHSKAASQLLEGFNAPLGTFSARIKASYSLGLITQEQFGDLELLRKIRNEFAHTWQPIDINKPQIMALVKEMNYSRIDDDFPETTTKKIRSSIVCLLIELHSTTDRISKKKMEARLIGNHIIAGFPGNFQEQLQIARDKFIEILQKIKSGKAEQSKFYLEKLHHFIVRLSFLKRGETSEQNQELNNFLQEAQYTVSQYPAGPVGPSWP